jgi:replicative DNA helicase
MGEVRIGDLLLGADGRPTRVVAATEVLTGRPCYDVEFSDGTVITADAEHQWLTSTRASRRPRSLPRSRWALSASCRERATAVAARYAAGPDTVVSVGEFIAEVGADFEPAVQKSARDIGSVGRAPRPASGPRRSYMWHTPVYSRRALSAALADRVTAPTASPQPAARATVVTTAQIAATLRCYTADGRPNHAVAGTAPLALDEQDLLLPPYVLGAWLGDGTSNSASLTCADEQIVEQIQAEGVLVRPTSGPLRHRLQLPRATAPERARRGTVQARLRNLGVLGHKHIPLPYLRASESQRRALLRGLLDTDGYATKSGTIEFGVTNRRLAEDVRELACGLGYRAALRAESVRGRTAESSTCYTVSFTTADRVFGLDRKAAYQVSATRAGTSLRYISDVRTVESVPVRCVQVDNDDHLYLAGRTMVPTHNSTLALDFARSAAVKNQKPTAVFSLEMGKLEIMMRLFSAEAGVALQNMRSGHMNDTDWRRLALRSSELAEAPLFIDDSPNLTMMEIRAKARRLRQRHDLQLIVIDYLQLMTSGKRVESRQQEVSEFSRSMKLLAKELDVPVVALSQLNRGPEQRTDKKPLLSDLRESGSIEQDSDVVLLVHRPDLYEPETERAGEADIIIAKHRNGPTATVAVAFQGRYSRFADMPN